MIEIDEQQTDKGNVTVRLIKMIVEMSEAQQLRLLDDLHEMQTEAYSLGKRDNKRKAYESLIEFTTKDGSACQGVSKDISLGGMFIRTDDLFFVGDKVVMTIPFSRSKKYIKVPAIIVRRTDNGIGVEFVKK